MQCLHTVRYKVYCGQGNVGWIEIACVLVLLAGGTPTYLLLITLLQAWKGMSACVVENKQRGGWLEEQLSSRPLHVHIHVYEYCTTNLEDTTWAQSDSTICMWRAGPPWLS